MFTPICSMFPLLYILSNPAGAVYAHNAPRLIVMLGLQLVWSARLLSHAIKRGFYELKGEDYRYTQVRKIVPRWAFALLHLFVIAVAQPILLFSLSLPLHAVLILPPAELSGMLGLSIPFSTIRPFLPASFQNAAPPSTPILNIGDLILVVIGLSLITIEGIADHQMISFQSSKYAQPPTAPMVEPKPIDSGFAAAPKPARYPASHHPGFITTGLFKISRHPNFACEQLFWTVQALFVIGGADSSGVTRTGWLGGGIFGPCFAVCWSRSLSNS